MDKFIVVLFCYLASATAWQVDDLRIVNGTNAKPGQFPHQVSMRKFNTHMCGGAILNPTTILTAGHCVTDTIDDYTIVVGSNTLNEGGVSHEVTKFILHEDYHPTLYINDVALVKIDAFNPIVYNDLVQPTKLALVNPENNTQLTMSGWGYTSDNPPAPNDLKMFDGKAMDPVTCKEKMGPTNTPISAGNICVFSHKGQGSCSGDSGGPLIDTKTREQVGVASWVSGWGCATGRPDVFTSVAAFRDWILKNGV